MKTFWAMCHSAGRNGVPGLGLYSRAVFWNVQLQSVRRYVEAVRMRVSHEAAINT